MKAIGKKLDRYKNPWLELKIQYGQNKGKLYNEECDRFMVRLLDVWLLLACSISLGYWFSVDHISNGYVFMSLHSYAWSTSLDMAIGMNSKQHSAPLHCSVLIGLWSPALPKNLLGAAILSFVWLREKIKSLTRGRDKHGKIRNLPRLEMFVSFMFHAFYLPTGLLQVRGLNLGMAIQDKDFVISK